MYQLVKNYYGPEPVHVKRLSDNAVIPLNVPDNVQCREFMKWVAERNEALPADE